MYRNEHLKGVIVRANVIRNEPVYPPAEWLRGHRVTQVRDRRPSSPQTAPLLSAQWNGAGSSDKGQGFGCDKRGSCVLPRPCSIHCERPSKGQVLTTRRIWLCTVRYPQTLLCVYMRLAQWMGGRKTDTDGERGSGGVQGRFLPAASCCRKA